MDWTGCKDEIATFACPTSGNDRNMAQAATARIAAIAVLAMINYRGVIAGAMVQKSFTVAKVIGLLIIIFSGLLFGSHASATPSQPAAPLTLGNFGVALIACLLAYDSWVSVSFVAGEIKNPQRNIGFVYIVSEDSAFGDGVLEY